MAKYCRYCAAVMKDTRDNFCYKCRKPGKPVGVLYKYADRAPISEDDKDIVIEYGEKLLAIGLIMGLFPFVFLIPGAIISANTGDKTFFIVLPIVLVWLVLFGLTGFMGIRLMLLKKKAVDKKWKISLIMLVAGLFRSNRRGAAVISAATSAPKKIERERLLKAALVRLASGKEDFAELESPPEDISLNKTWICGFCGYENPRERSDCKSCGKNR